MKNKGKILITVVLSMFLLSCGNIGDKKNDKVLYESDNKKIKVYESEVNHEFEKQTEGVDVSLLPKEQVDQLKKKIIQAIALSKAIEIEGKALNYDKSEKFKIEEEIAKRAALQNFTVMEKLNSVKVTDEEAKEIYNLNKENYKIQEATVKLQLIVSKDKAKATEALNEVKSKSADFGKLVEKYSEEKNNSGMTTDIPESILEQNYKAIKDAISNKKAGEVVDQLVTIGEDNYIIKVLEKNAAGTIVPFEKLKTQIIEQRKNEKKEEKMQEFMKEINEKYKLDKIQ